MAQFTCENCGKMDELDKAVVVPITTRDGITVGQTYICDKCDMITSVVVGKPVPPSDNTCVCCGEIIPEGMQVCPICIQKAVTPIPELTVCNTFKKESSKHSVDIHKIIDDAMEKRDRTVSIYIGEAGVSVNVYPVDHDKVQWISVNVPDGYGGFIASLKCSNCGYVLADIRDKGSYCSGCGELMHGVRKEDT